MARKMALCHLVSLPLKGILCHLVTCGGTKWQNDTKWSNLYFIDLHILNLIKLKNIKIYDHRYI